MKVDWNTDNEANMICWKEINKHILNVRHYRKERNLVLDVGGGSGWYGYRLKDKENMIACIDINPRIHIEEVRYIKGSALDLPFRSDAVDIVVYHAVLHHFSNGLEKSFREVSGSLKDGGVVFIQEPLSHNPINNLARCMITTTHHDPDEAPLSPEILMKEIEAVFDVKEVEYHFLLSYLLPHLGARVPKGAHFFFIKITEFLHILDKRLLETMPRLNRYAGYISCIAVKKNI